MTAAYRANSGPLLEFLGQNSQVIGIEADQSLDKILKEINKHIEPTIMHVRPNPNQVDLRNEIIHSLINEQGFIELDIQKIAQGFFNHGSMLGKIYKAHSRGGKRVPVEMTIELLRNSIYGGQPDLNKFLLTNFPDEVDQVADFEESLCQITAIIYPAAGDESVVEIKDESSTLTIESMFQKKMKLKTMKEWSLKAFEEKMTGKKHFGIIIGKGLVGKSTVAAHMQASLGFQTVDMSAEMQALREEKGTEDGPFEGEISIQEIEQRIIGKFNAAKANTRFIFDDFKHKTEDEFITFIGKLGVPDFILFLTAKEDTIKQRYMKKNEIEEVTEDQVAELKADSEVNKVKRIALQKKAQSAFGDKCQLINQSTDRSMESLEQEITKKFKYKLIVIRHEQTLPVDTVCSNLSIVHNLLYIPVSKLICDEIINCTALGDKLVESRHLRELQKYGTFSDDEDDLPEYNAIHYDPQLVYQLIIDKIAECRTNQRYVIINGLLNANLLRQEDDKLQIRVMDEFHQLEQYLGQINGIISLQYSEDPVVEDPAFVEYHKFPKEEPVEQKAKKAPGEGDEDEVPDEQPAPDEGEEAQPKWDPKDYTWTVTNRRQKNLANIFVKSRGPKGIHEVKQSRDYGISRGKQIGGSIESFVQQIMAAEADAKTFYQQVIFKGNN